MTAFGAILEGKARSRKNIKEARRQQLVRPHGFWGVENFVPVAPNEWVYTWQGVDCPIFEVIESGSSEITAILDGGEITATFTNGHIEVKNWLDDQIFRLMKLQSDVDCPLEWQPIVVSGQAIGPEIDF